MLPERVAQVLDRSQTALDAAPDLPPFDGPYVTMAAWTRNHLEGYWEPWIRRSRAASPTAMAMLGDWGVAHGVLGVSRCHYTLSTGSITSKSGAGQHARAVFPGRWHGIVDEALRCRPSPPGPPRRSITAAMDRRDEAVAFMKFALEASRQR